MKAKTNVKAGGMSAGGFGAPTGFQMLAAF